MTSPTEPVEHCLRQESPLVGADLSGLTWHAAANPNRIALRCLDSGMQWTYAELHAYVRGIGNWLASRCCRGDRIAWLGRNGPKMLATHLACARLGVIFVPVNWRLSTQEVTAVFEDALPSLIVADQEFFPLCENPPATAVLIDSHLVTTAPAEPSGMLHRQSGPQDVAALLYTSGTTGRPKGAILTEHSIYFSCVNLATMARMGADSVFLCDPPMFHVIGLVAISRGTLLAGGTVLMASRFEASATYQRLTDRALAVTHYFTVPQAAKAIRTLPDFDASALRSIRAFLTGGAPLSPEDVREWLDLGVPLLNGYGLTEAGSVSLMPPGDRSLLYRKAGSCGLPLLVTSVQIADSEGNELAPGQVGEIELRGPNLAGKYWKRPAETEAAFGTGWFKTGDLGFRDEDGYLFVVDRKKDMYISGGENVYPAEVETVLAGLAAVAEVAVVGVPDSRWGEVGCAYVSLRAGMNLSLPDIEAHCQGRLARYKVPKHLRLLPAIPRTASGKAQKHALRASFRTIQ